MSTCRKYLYLRILVIRTKRRVIIVSETINISPEDIFGLIALSGDAKASYHQAMLLMQEGKKEEAEASGMSGAKVLDHSLKLVNKLR